MFNFSGKIYTNTLWFLGYFVGLTVFRAKDKLAAEAKQLNHKSSVEKRQRNEGKSDRK